VKDLCGDNKGVTQACTNHSRQDDERQYWNQGGKGG